MSEILHPRIPAVTLGWRLKMALGDMDAIEMADALGVHRSTVARWMADRGAPPRRAYVLQWALITNTDVDWLLWGKVPTQGGDDDGVRQVRTPPGRAPNRKSAAPTTSKANGDGTNKKRGYQ